MDVKEKDWLLFKNKIGMWQGDYIDSLIPKYMEILSADDSSVVKFCKMEMLMAHNQKSLGVKIYPRRKTMLKDIVILLKNGIISINDLSEFSEELQQFARLAFIVECAFNPVPLYSFDFDELYPSNAISKQAQQSATTNLPE